MDTSELKPKKKIQSSIPELTVGEERKLFNQIRKSAAYIQPDTLLFNGWTAGGFALTYIIQHHMKRKRKAEEKTFSEDGGKKPRTKTFEDPSTVTSLDDQPNQAPEPAKPKPKRKAVRGKKESPPAGPPELVRQTAATSNDEVQLEFCEIKDISEINKVENQPTKVKKPVAKRGPRKKQITA